MSPVDAALASPSSSENPGGRLVLIGTDIWTDRQLVSTGVKHDHGLGQLPERMG